MRMPALAPSLAIVIVNYRTADFVIRAMDALARERSAAEPFEVIIVDGASGDGSAERLAAHFAEAAWRGWVSVLPLAINGGFGWANNQAILQLLQRSAPPDYIHLLNPDAVVEPGAVAALLAVIRSNPQIGAVGSQLIEPTGEVAGSAFRFPSVGREFLRGCGIARLGAWLGVAPTLVERAEPGPADWLTGASVMVRSAALRETALFDDGFFLYFEEVELMHRMGKAGWQMWFVPASRVMHIGGAATGVASGGQIAVRPYPAYHFASRRRYFMLTGGLAGLLAANLAWLAGRVLGYVARPLLGRRGEAVPRELRMTLRYGFWPTSGDRRRSPTRWDAPPGQEPAWRREAS
ncbi:MAG TPA: glycosyltransferase family 2 protein [Sphingobium sp.]|nr:glycosyltransferase family 2 protein [Sphingobium sp.]